MSIDYTKSDIDKGMKAMQRYLDVIDGVWRDKIIAPKKAPIVQRIIYSGGKTIVLWEDGTKTIVGCSEGETYDEFDGFTAALAKKIYGSTCAVKREIRKKSNKQIVKQEMTEKNVK